MAFVHEGSLGHADYAEIPDYKVHWKDNRYVSDEIAVYADADGTGNFATIYYTFEILRPTVARLKKVNYETGEIFSMLFAVLPEEEESPPCLRWFLETIRLMHLINIFAIFSSLLLNKIPVLWKVKNQKELPLDLQAELRLNPDRLSIAYRRWLGDLGVTFGSDVGSRLKKAAQ